MSLKTGIVGLPNVGKSSLFQALTKKMVESANYAFTTIEPNIATVNLYDPRLEKLAKLVQPEKIVPAAFDFVDIAGLVKGASEGEGLGNKFLANIKEVDALVHVLRCFDNPDVMHVFETVDPIRDKEIINLELILADLSIIENVLKRITPKAMNTKDKEVHFEYNLVLKMQKLLNSQKPLREGEFSEKELKKVKSFQLLTLKPQIYVLNVAAENEDHSRFYELEKSIQKEKAEMLYLAVDLQKELSTIEDESEKLTMMELFEAKETGLNLLTRKAFDLLNLATYFTAGKKEVKAWIFKKGTLAPQGAGIIHSDFEAKFIKAEVISYNDFIACGSEHEARESGKMRLQGKTYELQDGDICHFKVGQ